MSDEATALLALWNDVDPALDAQYNDWHANEHVPERLTVPGILWGLRYGRPSTPGAPRYLTLYGLRDVNVLETEPYQRLLREPTPMSRTMRPALQNVSRWVCKVHEQAGLHSGSSHLAVWCLANELEEVRAANDALADAPGVRGRLLAERLADTSPLPWLHAGQDRGIDGRWLLCAALDEGQAGTRAYSDATIYARLPVG
jgi:hypothetical protein